MDLVGQCMICGKPASNACALCGSLVCDEHLNPRTRMCSNCVSKIEQVDERNRREQLGLYR